MHDIMIYHILTWLRILVFFVITRDAHQIGDQHYTISEGYAAPKTKQQNYGKVL